MIKRWLSWIDPRQVAIGLLAVWAVGLVVAAVQLDMWQNQLTRALVQLRADAQFRARVAHQRDQVDPEWYRRKALSLLSAMEKIRQNTRWMVFVPGSWQTFDDLEERLAARLEREFGEIVLETIRRELFLRASQLTGVPQQRGGGALRLPLECAAPSAPGGGRKLSAAPEDQPEFAAVRAYVASLQPLDEAVQSWLALQTPSDGGAEHLRRLVRYTLGAELPGPASRSLTLFASAADDAAAQPAAVLNSLQAATRCSLTKGMGALHARLLASNDLLAIEQALAERAVGLFDAARPLPFAAALERYRAVHALLQDQEAVLAQGRNGWMRQGTLDLGPDYEGLLQDMGRMRLLGPEVVQQLRGQATEAFQQFRRKFQAVYGGRGQPGIVWQDNPGRFSLSPERVALREGLAVLLREPFMQLREDGSALLPATLDQALALGDVRRRVQRDALQKFPAFARTSVSRVVDARLAQLAHDLAATALKASLPQDPNAPVDAAALRAQRERLAQVQALLVSLRAPQLAQDLASQQSGEVGRRLASMQEELRALPLFDAKAVEFGWWRGEPGPLLRAFGASDATSLQTLVSQQSAKFDALGRQAEQYLAAADASQAADPGAQRLQRLVREMERYRAKQPDSSLMAVERYVLTLGPYLRRENCTENLSSQTPPRHQDELALRLVQVHNALVQRCWQLRSQPSTAMQTTN